MSFLASVTDEKTGEGAAETGSGSGQMKALEETLSGIITHSFWKQGTATVFDIWISNIEAGSYLHIMPEKALAKVKK